MAAGTLSFAAIGLGPHDAGTPTRIASRPYPRLSILFRPHQRHTGEIGTRIPTGSAVESYSFVRRRCVYGGGGGVLPPASSSVFGRSVLRS